MEKVLSDFMTPDFGVMTQITNKLACLLVLVLLGASSVMAEKVARADARSIDAARLPIGVFAVPRDLLYLAKMKGFEIVHDYRFEEGRDNNDDLASYLDEARSLGLKVMVGLERNEAYTVPKALERVRRFRAHPALWAWYLCDEPKTAMQDQVAEMAAAIRREDAGHPLIIATDEAAFATLADTVFAYKYSVKNQPFPHQDLGSHVRRIDQFAQGGNPFCVLVQTFNWNRYLSFDKLRRDNRHPTTEEMRFMAFYGVMKGAKGVFFFSFQTLPVEYKNLKTVASLIDELKGLREYLAGDQVDATRYLYYQHAAAWRKQGRTLLLVTNPSGVKAEAPLNTGLWTLIDFKKPDVAISGGILPLKPWDVRLLLITKDPLSHQGTAP
jgi:hypothetical protein